jgi:hypothetical protein
MNIGTQFTLTKIECKVCSVVQLVSKVWFRKWKEYCVNCACSSTERPCHTQTCTKLSWSTLKYIILKSTYPAGQQFTFQSLPSGPTVKLCSVTTLLTPTTHNIYVGPAIYLTPMYTLRVLLSTAPSMYLTHNKYQKSNIGIKIQTLKYLKFCPTNTLHNVTITLWKRHCYYVSFS